MKKSLLLVAGLAMSFSAFSQDLKSKKGEPFLPEAGDISIGVDASPFLDYFGKMLSNSGASAPTWNNYGLNQTIVGKYFVDETTAYRGILRIGVNSNHMNADIADATATSAPTFPALPTMVNDEYKYGSHYIGLGAGMEMRRGHTRLQGFYGADLFFWMWGAKETYTYGNTLSSTVTVNNATTTDFGGSMIDGSLTSNIGNGFWGGRTTELKSGTQIGVGLRGFIGAEYFILPKISVAGEFGWGLGFATQGAETIKVEQNTASSTAGTVYDQNLTGKSGGLILDTDRNAANGAMYNFVPSGTLRLNFHF